MKLFRIPAIKFSLKISWSACCILLFSQCGYHFQGTQNALLERERIFRIFISPVTNNTYKAGVENLIYSSLLKRVSSQKMVRVTKHPEDADAILVGEVNSADYSQSAQTVSTALEPVGMGRSDTSVSTEYSASLQCDFTLKRSRSLALSSQEIKKRKLTAPNFEGEVLWRSSFSRQKYFPGSAQLSTLGTTTALINESEFERALSDLADSMMGDVHEAMLAMF